MIARLSAGERWDGDNAEVLRALGWEMVGKRYNQQHGYVIDETWKLPGGSVERRYPTLPLDSVDDALRLVPEGWFSTEVEEWCDSGGWQWGICKDSLVPQYAFGRAPTAAIALTIAILEASRG